MQERRSRAITRWRARCRDTAHTDEEEQAEYRRFEDIFRGSEEFIRERQRRYLP